MSRGKILFQLSGSIAAYKACSVISRLVQADYEVQTVASASALHFIGAATLEGLSGRVPLIDVFAPGQAMQHIHAMRWADLAILCPASANSLAKLAGGLGDDLISTLFLAHDFNKPYLLAPAMNATMYAHPATQTALARLRDWGVTILDSPPGALACGEYGCGRLLEPDAIFASVESALGRETPISGAQPKSAKVLVTSGGTREPIDAVRSIANSSTGRTGALIADELVRAGFDTTLLRARDSAEPTESAVSSRDFVTFSDLAEALSQELNSGGYSAVVHVAAVSDYSIQSIETDAQDSAPTSGKLSSGASLTLRLSPTAKLVDRLRDFAGSTSLRVIAFKLTVNATALEQDAAVRRLQKAAKPDWVVANDLAEIGQNDTHRSCLINASGERVADFANKSELARGLASILVASELTRRGAQA